MRRTRNLIRDFPETCQVAILLPLPLSLPRKKVFHCLIVFLLMLEDALQNGTVCWFYSRLGNNVTTRTILRCRSQSIFGSIFQNIQTLDVKIIFSKEKIHVLPSFVVCWMISSALLTFVIDNVSNFSFFPSMSTTAFASGIFMTWALECTCAWSVDWIF